MKNIFGKSVLKLAAGFAFLLSLWILFALQCGPTSSDMTFTNVWRLRSEIKSIYSSAESPSNESLRQICENKRLLIIRDGWGNKFNVLVEDSGVATIISLGKDNKVGGDGENQDFHWRFLLPGPADDVAWISEPSITKIDY